MCWKRNVLYTFTKLYEYKSTSTLKNTLRIRNNKNKKRPVFETEHMMSAKINVLLMIELLNYLLTSSTGGEYRSEGFRCLCCASN
jgi:hypothetical protein